MAHIVKKNLKSGGFTVVVQLNKYGVRSFCLTFDDWDAACEWVEKNETLYFKDPEPYFIHKRLMAIRCRREKIHIIDHIVYRKRR